MLILIEATIGQILSMLGVWSDAAISRVPSLGYRTQAPLRHSRSPVLKRGPLFRVVQ